MNEMIDAKRMIALLELALATLLVTSLLVVSAVRPAHADGELIFKVNTTADFNDLNPGDDQCDADAAIGDLCTLRAAIQESNATNELDVIHFNIPGSGVHTIAPHTELPIITRPVIIEGYSQPGASVNTATTGTNAAPKIVLSGADAPSFNPAMDGLTISSGGTTIRGLVINGFEHGQNSEGGTGILLLNIAGNTRNTITGNFIGTDAAGSTAVTNQGAGVVTFFNSTNNTIGGTAPGDRNLISGNFFDGIQLGSNNNIVQNNLIGTDRTGTKDLGNGLNGVGVSSSNNTLSANRIAFNGADGVSVSSSFSTAHTGNLLAGNSIFSNGGTLPTKLGIDLGFDGVTPNDSLDTDTGPNNLQNFPVLTSARTSRKGTIIAGKLNSTPSKIFVVQFFSNASGNEGQKFIGQTAVSTDSSGNVSFTFKPALKVRKGKITATAIDTASRNTSEFSAAKKVVPR